MMNIVHNSKDSKNEHYPPATAASSESILLQNHTRTKIMKFLILQLTALAISSSNANVYANEEMSFDMVEVGVSGDKLLAKKC